MEYGETFEQSINRSDYRILVVDDVMSNVLLLKILLTNEKFQVLTANNGTGCIQICKEQHPDLVLLDVMMPDISGFDTAVELKKNPETADIPIIFLTALNSPSDLVHGFQVGANDFLSKPFNKEELIMRVMHQISLVAAKRIIVQQNIELKRTISNRDKMYSVIAHDLRSPMASIRMVLNLVVQTVSPEAIGPEMYYLIDKANRETEETHDLLDNLLKWTKSQTGVLPSGRCPGRWAHGHRHTGRGTGPGWVRSRYPSGTDMHCRTGRAVPDDCISRRGVGYVVAAGVYIDVVVAGSVHLGEVYRGMICHRCNG